MGKSKGVDPYKSPNLPVYEDATQNAVLNRLGAKKRTAQTQVANPGTSQIGSVSRSAGTPTGGFGYFGTPTLAGTYGPSRATPSYGGNQSQESEWDFSDVGKPLSGANAVNTATEGYDFSPINKAIAGFSNAPTLNQTYNSTYNPKAYNPYQFNYGQLPEEYTNMAYQSGASDINKAGADRLAQLKESTGTRRPGLFLKAGEDVSRDTGKNLAGLNTQLQLNKINQNLALSKAEQEAQAGENFKGAQFGEQQAQFGAGEGYKGYQSRSDLEKANTDNAYRYLQGLLGAGAQDIGLKSGLVNNERAYQDQAIQYLLNLYGGATGSYNQAAGINQQKNNSTLGLLGDIAGVAAKIPW